MAITKEQRAFIKKLAPGIEVYMSAYNMADAIWKNPVTDVELYIEEHILDYVTSAVFSKEKFCQAVDTLPNEKLRELLLYFDANDMPLCDVYTESHLDTKDFSASELVWSRAIMDGNLLIFRNF